MRMDLPTFDYRQGRVASRAVSLPLNKTRRGTLEPSCLCPSMVRDGSLLFPRRDVENLAALVGLNSSFASITQEGTRLFDCCCLESAGRCMSHSSPGRPPYVLCEAACEGRRWLFVFGRVRFSIRPLRTRRRLRDASLWWCARAACLLGTMFVLRRFVYVYVYEVRGIRTAATHQRPEVPGTARSCRITASG